MASKVSVMRSSSRLYLTSLLLELDGTSRDTLLSQVSSYMAAVPLWLNDFMSSCIINMGLNGTVPAITVINTKYNLAPFCDKKSSS